MKLDHVVLWVDDPLRSLDFYEKIVGLSGVRVEEFKAGKCPFPSVRISEHSIVDLMSKLAAPVMNSFPGAAGSAGNKVNHVCLAMTKGEYDALRARLDANGIAMPHTLKSSFGAQGIAPEAIYFSDPDGNMLEARYYEG
jgi:glyoxylase I family protein